MALRTWCFTTFNVPDEDGGGFSVPTHDPLFRYCVFQLEMCPRTGQYHYQGYIEFTRAMRMTQVKKLCTDNTMHVESRQGTQKQARDYCMKEDTRVPGTQPFEYGTFTTERGKGQGKRTDLHKLMDAVKAGMTTEELFAQFPTTYARYHRAVAHCRHIKAVDKPSREEVGDLQVLLFIGKPGTGKTRAAFEQCINNELTLWSLPIGNTGTLWFDNYNAEDVVLLDDFAGRANKIGLSDLLRLLDRYPIQVPVKGAFVWWCPYRIVITTNVHPKDWYDYSTRTDSMAALKRRIHGVINFDVQADHVLTVEEFWPTETAFDVIMATALPEGVRRVTPAPVTEEVEDFMTVGD